MKAHKRKPQVGSATPSLGGTSAPGKKPRHGHSEAPASPTSGASKPSRVEESTSFSSAAANKMGVSSDSGKVNGSFFPVASALLPGRGRSLVTTRHVTAGEVVLVCAPAVGVVLPHNFDSHCSGCFAPFDGGSGARSNSKRAASASLRACPGCSAVAFCGRCWETADSTLLHGPRVCAALKALAGLVADGTASEVLRRPSSGGQIGEEETCYDDNDAPVTKEQLEAFYKRVDPTKLANVAEILARFSAREIRANLMLKYRAVLPAPTSSGRGVANGDEGGNKRSGGEGGDGDDEGEGADGASPEALNMCQLVASLLCKRLDAASAETQAGESGLGAARAFARQIVSGGRGGVARVGGGADGEEAEEDRGSGADGLFATLSLPVMKGDRAALAAGSDAALVDSLEDHLSDFPVAQQQHFAAIGRLVVMACLPKEAAALAQKEQGEEEEQVATSKNKKAGRNAGGGDDEAAAKAKVKKARLLAASRCRVAVAVEEWAAKTCGRVACNGHGVSHDGEWRCPEAALQLGNRAAAVAVYPTGSLFNHSCCPSATVSFDGSGHLIATAAAPIKAGDEVTISYSAGLASGAQRRHDLQDTYFFDCACPKCAIDHGEVAAAAMGGADDDHNAAANDAARVAESEACLGAYLCRACGCGAVVWSVAPPDDTAAVWSDDEGNEQERGVGGRSGGLEKAHGKKAKKKQLAKLTHAEKRQLERQKKQQMNAQLGKQRPNGAPKKNDDGDSGKGKGGGRAIPSGCGDDVEPAWRCLGCGHVASESDVGACEAAALALSAALAEAADSVSVRGQPGGEGEEEGKEKKEKKEDEGDEDEDKDVNDEDGEKAFSARKCAVLEKEINGGNADQDQDGDVDGGGDQGGGGGCGGGGDPGEAYNTLRSALAAASVHLHPQHALRFACHAALLGLATMLAARLSASPAASPASALHAGEDPPGDAGNKGGGGVGDAGSGTCVFAPSPFDPRAGLARACDDLRRAPGAVKEAARGHASAALGCLIPAALRGEYDHGQVVLEALRRAASVPP